MLDYTYIRALENADDTGSIESLKILLRNKVPLWPLIDKFEEQDASAIIADRKELTQYISTCIFNNANDNELVILMEQLAELAGPYLSFKDPSYIKNAGSISLDLILDYANESYYTLEKFRKGEITQTKGLFSIYRPNNPHFREMAIITNNLKIQELLDSYESESQKMANDLLKKLDSDQELVDVHNLGRIVQENPIVSLVDPSQSAAEQEKAINLMLYWGYSYSKHLESYILNLPIMIDPGLIEVLKKKEGPLKDAYEITDLALYHHQRNTYTLRTTFKLIENYEYQALKRDFPLNEEDKKVLISAIESGDLESVKSMLGKNIYPDLECYDIATLYGSEELRELVKESLLKNQFSKALKDNNIVSIFLLNERGVVDVKTCLENLNSPAIVELLFKAAREQYGPDKYINRLLELKPDLFEKHGKDISDNCGNTLLSDIIKSNNLALLDELRETGSKISYDSITVHDFNLFIITPKSKHDELDLLPMISKLRQNGWYPDIKLIEGLFSRIRTSRFLQPHQKQEAIEFLNNEGFGYATEEFKSEINRIGHVMGLVDDSIPVGANNGPQKNLTLQFEGGNSVTSLSYLSDHVNEYIHFLKDGNDANEADFSAVKEILDFSKRQFDGFKTKDGAAEEFLNQYHNGNIVSLPTVYNAYVSNHAVSIVLYKGYLVYTNRGHASASGAKTNIFKLKDPALITSELINKLISKTEVLDYLDFEKTLETLVDLKNPLTSFPTKVQKRGNCSYVNQKSAIEPLLCLVQARKEGGADFTDETLKQVAKKSIENREKGSYKKFTKFAGDYEIKRIIKKMLVACHEHPVAINYYYNLFKVIINQLNGKISDDVKNQYEIGQINALLNALPPDKQPTMRQELPFLNDLLNKRSLPVSQTRPQSVVFRDRKSSKAEPPSEQTSEKNLYEMFVEEYLDPSTTGSKKAMIEEDLVEFAEDIISKADLDVAPAKIEWEKMINKLESKKEISAGLLHRINELPGAEKLTSEKMKQKL